MEWDGIVGGQNPRNSLRDCSAGATPQAIVAGIDLLALGLNSIRHRAKIGCRDQACDSEERPGVARLFEGADVGEGTRLVRWVESA